MEPEKAPVQAAIEGAAKQANPDDCVVEMYRLDRPNSSRYQTKLGRWSFDAATRVLSGPYVTYEIDGQDRVVKRTENNSPFSTSYTYDSNGYNTGIHTGSGSVVVVNHYQDGRRVRVESTRPGEDGKPSLTRISYRYQDPASPLWTHQDIDLAADGVVDQVWKRDLVAGFELRTGPDDKLDTVYAHQYEGGRLKRRQRDHGFWYWQVADGKMDLSMTWSYDAEGRLQTSEQDGVDTFDNPQIDGFADVRQVYSTGCQTLIARFPWVGNLPAADLFTFGDQPQ